MAKLEALETVTALRLLTHDIEDTVYELSSFGIVALCPIISRASLAKDKVVGTKELAKGSRAHAVHGTGFKVHENRTWHIPASGCLVEVHINALELQVGVAMVSAGRIDSVFIADHFPELGTNLVSALACLDMNELTHDDRSRKREKLGVVWTRSL